MKEEDKMAKSNVYKNEICFREQDKEKTRRSQMMRARELQLRHDGSYKFYYNYHDCAFFLIFS